MGSGIPEVEGQLTQRISLQWWPILWRKFIAGVLAIGSGMYLGREGPSIQLGAAVGQGMGEHLETSTTNQRILLASGAAAGLSAAFNAPIAGTLFILEEVYHDFSPLIWMTSLAAAISADIISMNIFGLKPVLYMANLPAFPLHYYYHLLILGLFLGGLSFLYQRVLLITPVLYAKYFHWLPRRLHGLIPLILVIPLGYFLPQTLGGGNSLILSLSKLNLGLKALLILFLLRFIFSMISYGSGLAGGIFLPILTLGAIIGTLYGTIVVKLGLMPSQYIINLLVFAMAAYFAGIGKAPFTAILLITEMVGSLQHLVPLAILSLVAYIVDDLLGGAPIYESLLTRMTIPQTLHKISGQPEHLELPIFADSSLVGQQVRDIKWPKGCLLIGLRQGEQTQIVHGDTIIRAGTTLIILTDHSNVAAVRQVINQATN